MKALFLGNVAADTAEGIRAELPPGLEVAIIADPRALVHSPEAAAEADILVSNHWRADYPPAPKLRLVQSVATGVELFDLAVLPRGVAICNSFGHETAIAEYVVMVWLALHHRLLEISGEFRERASWRTSWVESGTPHGEVRGSTLGIVGYGRVGHEVARRAAPFGVRILAANRSAREPEPGVERVFPLAALDQMLPLCDTVALCTALGPETEGLIDARRLAPDEADRVPHQHRARPGGRRGRALCRAARPHDRRRGARCLVANADSGRAHAARLAPSLSRIA